jgi:hypothetical protein
MVDSEGITVTFLDQTGAKSVKAKISPTVQVKKIVPNIITKMTLPVMSPDGTPMSYSLDHKEGGKRLKEDQTLPEAGVKEGDHLIVYPEITAGGVPLAEIFAFVAENPKGDEGLAVLALRVEDGMIAIPLVAQNEEHAAQIAPQVEAFEQASGKKTRLARFVAAPFEQKEKA